MPVVFAPAEPVGEQIAAGYGATEQFNRSLPALSNLAESIARNRQAGSNAELAAQVQTNIASGQLAGQHEAQTAANDLHRYMQGQQIQADRQMQERRISAAQDAQFTDWALRGNAVSQQEVNHMQRLQNGISEVTQQVNSGQLTKEEGADLIVQMKTGISPIKNRLDQQHAEAYAAQAKQHMDRAALENAVLRKNLEIQGKSTTDNAQLDPQAELLERDRLKPKYQALAAVIGADAAQMQMEKEVRENVIRGGHYKDIIGISSHGTAEYRDMTKAEATHAARAKAEPPQIPGEAGTFTTKTGGFDYAAAKKDATARAEADPAFINQETGKLNTEGHKWVQARADGLERE